LQESLQLLIENNCCDSILTSGLAKTAEQGIPVLKRMLEICGDQIEIVVAGKVVPENLSSLQQTLHATSFHGRRIVGEL
jgi:copper homeostasis protein